MPESLADVPGLCDKSCDTWFCICTVTHGMLMITVLLENVAEFAHHTYGTVCFVTTLFTYKVFMHLPAGRAKGMKPLLPTRLSHDHGLSL